MRASPSPLLMSKMNATKQNYHNGRHNTNYSPLHESWGDWNKKLSRKISLTSNKYLVKSSTHDLKSHIIFLLFSDWLTPLSMALSNLLSPVIIGLCRRKSTRVTAVLGGFITALGCLFTSFASQFHQLYFSYGAMIGSHFLLPPWYSSWK